MYPIYSVMKAMSILWLKSVHEELVLYIKGALCSCLFFFGRHFKQKGKIIVDSFLLCLNKLNQQTLFIFTVPRNFVLFYL